MANPYLRWAVVFDEYVKNRDVWRCPSAKVEGGAGLIMPGPDWFSYLKAYEGIWNVKDVIDGGPCHHYWPPGWGGEVTDSFAQLRWAGGGLWGQGGQSLKPFAQSIGVNLWDKGRKLVELDDPVNYMIVGDAGTLADDIWNVSLWAYPDLCAVECSAVPWAWVDWEGCADWAADCGLYYWAPNDGAFLYNKELLKRYSRHLGGVNVGFLDGHAQWINSTQLINSVKEGELAGTDQCCTNQEKEDWCGYPDYPGFW
jgi:prepilin-type processing-associated H-X9-DG protein